MASGAAIALAIATEMLSTGWHPKYYGFGHDWGFAPLSFRLWAFAILLLILAFA